MGGSRGGAAVNGRRGTATRLAPPLTLNSLAVPERVCCIAAKHKRPRRRDAGWAYRKRQQKGEAGSDRKMLELRVSTLSRTRQPAVTF